MKTIVFIYFCWGFYVHLSKILIHSFQFYFLACDSSILVYWFNFWCSLEIISILTTKIQSCLESHRPAKDADLSSKLFLTMGKNWKLTVQYLQALFWLNAFKRCWNVAFTWTCCTNACLWCRACIAFAAAVCPVGFSNSI